MKLAQTQTGKIIVTRRTKHGAYERMGELTTTLSLKEAKAKYHDQLEQFESFYNSQPNARYHLREAIRRFDRDVVSHD